MGWIGKEEPSRAESSRKISENKFVLCSSDADAIGNAHSGREAEGYPRYCFDSARQLAFEFVVVRVVNCS